MIEDVRRAPPSGADEPSIGVLIVDDQPVFRAVARRLVGVMPGFEVVGEAETGEEAIVRVAESGARFVLMDVNLPGLSGIEVTRRLTLRVPSIVVLLMSADDDASSADGIDRCGASGFVRKEELSPSSLRDAWEYRRDPPALSSEGHP